MHLYACILEARGGTIIVLGNGLDELSSNPGLNCVSHCTNDIGKDMNPFVLPPIMENS